MTAEATPAGLRVGNNTERPIGYVAFARDILGLDVIWTGEFAVKGPTLMLGDLHRRSPFWWEGPDGSRVLLWYARHYHQIGSQFGLPPKLANGYEGLQTFLNVYERPDYAPDAVLMHGICLRNAGQFDAGQEAQRRERPARADH